MAAHDLLKNNPKLEKKVKITMINQKDKDKYKTDEIETFPQIYLKKKNHNDSLLIGGYSNIKELFDLFYKKNYNKNEVDNYLNNNKQWSKHGLLRFIEMINLN